MRCPALALTLLIAGLVGCGARGGGPAWPKSAVSSLDPDDPASDGGESLDPRQTGAVASVETSTATEPVVEATPAAATPEATTPEVEKPAETPVDPTPAVEPPIEGEIVIEITD